MAGSRGTNYGRDSAKPVAAGSAERAGAEIRQRGQCHQALPPLLGEELAPLSEVLEDMDQIADRLLPKLADDWLELFGGR